MPEEIKKEPVEEDDGTYVCFICAESVGGRDALQWRGAGNKCKVGLVTSQSYAKDADETLINN